MSKVHAVRKRLQHPLVTFLLSLVIATVLAVMLGVVTSSLPYFSSSPTTDPNFGALNQCLLDSLPKERIGFAVHPDGSAAASFTGDALAICRTGKREAERYTLSGIVHATFDTSGKLWLSRRASPDGSELWLLDGQHARHVGEVKPSALVGTGFGVVALEGQGHLVSIAADETVLGVTDLKPLAENAQLLASADGDRIAIGSAGGLWVLDAQRLFTIRSEAPCTVGFLWWRPQGHTLRVSCEPDFAIDLETDSGSSETAPRLTRTPSALVPGARVYVQPCDGLPCTASSP